MSESSVAQFYDGLGVFITGASGFIGMALVEKILRSCNGVKWVYVLLRSKKGVDVQQRLENILSNPLFSKVKSKDPDCIRKVVGVSGDITLPQLGLSNEDYETLCQNVNVVFHLAASVRFDDPLKDAVNMNVLGAIRVVDLCHRIKNLKCYIYVSTAYAHCNRFVLSEEFYPPPMDPDKLIDAVEWMDNDLLQSITPYIIKTWPNTYTFTKAIAEAWIEKHCSDLPMAIVRPSIVNNSWREPIPGWTEGMSGLTAIFVVCAKGLMRTMRTGNCGPNIIPVDVVVNLMLCVSWYVGSSRPKTIPIYHAAAEDCHEQSWDDIFSRLAPTVFIYPSMETFRFPEGGPSHHLITERFFTFIGHTIPGAIGDSMLYLFGQKPRLRKIYKKIHKATRALEYFSIHRWSFKKDNVYKLEKTLSEADRNEFNFSLEEWHPISHLENAWLGIRRYVLKESPATLPVARKKLQRLYVISRLIECFLIWTFYKLFLSHTTIVQNIWQGIGYVAEGVYEWVLTGVWS